MTTPALPPAMVTYGWCRSSYTVVRSLAAHGVTVHVADSSRFAMTRFSRYAASFNRLPDFYTAPVAYIDALGEAMRRRGAQVLLPGFEDIELIMRHRDRLPEAVQVALPAIEDWAVAEDKLDYLARVGAAGCPVPESWTVRDDAEVEAAAAAFDYPALVKVRMGNGARGVEIVESPTALKESVRRLVKTFDLPAHRWPIIQRQLRGRKFKLDGVFCNGEPVGMAPFEILRCKGAGKFGTSTYRRSVEQPAVVEYATTALKALNWHGMFNTDWICDDAGVPHLIDINGRLSGAVAVPYEAGIDLPWLWYQVSAGLTPDTGMQAQSDVHVRWLLGDGIALVEHLLTGKFRHALGALRPVPGCRHDDFHWRDPLPLFGEAADYLYKFIASRGSVRPVTEGMVR
ncbi:ATP-grasp domain-containing protein [Spiribacter sp. 221]|uniref:carboxylate--amine ligase n=1 Tax=Spiribacter onubensis TaxID=3122420 RepID=UPI00349F1104